MNQMSSPSNGNFSVQKNLKAFIDYYRNPVLGRLSAGQLLLRRGLMGFSNLVWVSGDWRSLGSPFCRLGKEIPVKAECEPEFVVQHSVNATMSAGFCGPDSIGIEISSRIVQKLYSGAPGKIHHNGGTAQQQWMAFDAFRDGATLAQSAPGMLISRNGDYCGVFMAAGIQLAQDGNGWFAPVEAGKTFVGVGIAYRNPELAMERARLAMEILYRDQGLELVRKRLRKEWQIIFKSFPWPLDIAPDLIDLGCVAAWGIFSNIAAPEGLLTRRSVLSSKIQYPGIFPWDSVFNAVALKEADPELAKDQIEMYVDQIHESTDGYVCGLSALAPSGEQFPAFSWAAWRIYQTTRDADFLSRIYEPLAKHAAWWLRPEGTRRGVPVYLHVVCLDDSPRFDMFNAEQRMSLKEPVFGADLIAFCALDHLYLARIAETLARNACAQRHREIAAELSAFNETALYDEELGRYFDLGAETGRRGTVNTPLNHFPAVLSSSANRRSRAAQALSPEGPFWGEFGLAMVSAEETSFDPCRIWRGPIWFNVNFHCAEACWQMGFPEVAEAIARSTIDIVRINAPLPNGIMESFNYLTGQGSGAHHMSGLGSAAFICFLLGHHREITHEIQ